jgi:hypothetical protein
MRRFPDLLVGFLLGFALLLVIFLLSSDMAAHYEICETTREGAKECASYNVLPYALRKVGAALDAYNGLITAIATIFIAWFTFSLRRSTDKLWDAGERQLKFLADNAASQSSDMQASLEVSRAAAKAAAEAAYSERAWVTPETLDGVGIRHLFVDGVEYDEGLGAIVKWKNTGRSPAIRLEIYSLSKILPSEAATPIFDEEVPNPEEVRGILGPTVIASSQLLHICGEDLSGFREKKVRWYVYSRATYSTIFEPEIRRVSEVCVRVEWNGDIRQSDGSYAPRINFTAIGIQNRAS